MPHFLNTQANELINWFTTSIHARTQLAVLLRKLIQSTGHELQKVDFPGNDDAERPGWDGFLETSSSNAWIPDGISGWEFGVTESITKKADGDFEKSVRATNDAERRNITFVFVTPRRWQGKVHWVKKMKGKNLWKDIRAYDASDLEQWMEQSVSSRIWFANETGRPSDGVRTLERCWADWANVTDPYLHSSLFGTAIQAWNCEIKSFFEKCDSKPLVITADSMEEALAFLKQVFDIPELEQYRDRVLVFDKTEILPKIAQETTDFIVVAHTREVERELAPYCTMLRSIVVYPRNAARVKSDIVLEPLGTEPFRKALESMGKSRDDIAVLEKASGRSLTVLRRQLSNVPAIGTPEWADDSRIASDMVPLVLAGTWDAQNEADRTLLSLLAEVSSYELLEKRILNLLQLNDSPVWSLGNLRGVISKKDAIFAIKGSVSKADLYRFLEIAQIVLGEDDPALDLPEKERWAAGLYGKKREFSGVLREGISETLVLLAVHGKDLFGKHLGFDGELEAAKIVRELLMPLTTRKLEANNRDLPLYAEAAPRAFLNIIEQDLQSDNSEVLGLLRPVGTWIFSTCPRTGLLWALEALAWNPHTFPRVVNILGRLSEVEINDNWVNKPFESLSSILRVWMPQTAADQEMRVRAVKMLLDKHPVVGWRVCLKQMEDYGTRIGRYNYKPKWRRDGYGYGEPLMTFEKIHASEREMIELVLTRQTYTPEMLCDLVSKLHVLVLNDQERVWKIIEDWRISGAPDEDIAKVREKIRVAVLSRRGHKWAGDESQAFLKKKAKEVYDELLPKDILNNYEWLFRQVWFEGIVEGVVEEEDFQTREKEVQRLRIDALTEIARERGIPGILELSERGNSRRLIGAYLVSDVLAAERVQDLILTCLRSENNCLSLNEILAGALWSLNKDRRKAMLASLRNKISEEELLRLLLLSPYRASTWEIVDQLSAEARNGYWVEVIPQYSFDSFEENNESIRRLLEVKRPRAAFASVRFNLEKINPSLIIQMLSDMLKNGQDKEGEYLLNSYDVREAFQLLDRKSDLSLEEKARLEFSYLGILDVSSRGEDKHGIPNLELYTEQHPELFVQAIVWTYKRKNGGEDLIEGDKDSLAQCGYRFLEAIERIPGLNEATKKEQQEKLSKWVEAVRRACADLDRLEVADEWLGNLFSHAPVGEDGVWPDEAVRNVMENIRSQFISRGAHMGLFNSRGAHFCGKGGAQERELANKYRVWADALQFTHPFVSSSLLMSMVYTYECEAERLDIETEIRSRVTL